MKKSEIKSHYEIFGKSLPVAKIKDANTRKEIILLATSLSSKANEIESQLQEILKRLSDGHEKELQEWSALMQKAKYDLNASEQEKVECLEKANKMTEAVRINDEYSKTVEELMNEDVDINIHKVDIMVIFDALIDSGILADQNSIDVICNQFKDLIK